MCKSLQHRESALNIPIVVRILVTTVLSSGLMTYPGGGGLTAGQPTSPAAPAEPPSNLAMIGYVETVAIFPGNIRVTAKIDTGARTSSLDARDIEPFRKDGKKWVRFTVHGDDNTSSQMELLVARTVRIRRADEELDRRYVIKLGICLGSFYKMAEVNLEERKRMRYRMLIGRNFTAGVFAIDPNSQFLTNLSCRNR